MNYTTLKLRCLYCREWSESPIRFADGESFDTATLVGNRYNCPNCGKISGCNKENMKFEVRDDKDGEPNSGFRGKDTF